jgi:hypothetical protein
MTIDERLDRLVQRHEALTESVQMLLLSHREHEQRSEKQFAQHQQQFAQHQEEFAQHEQLFGQIALRLREVTDGIDRLARVAGVHQERLDDQQQRLGDLERGPRS